MVTSHKYLFLQSSVFNKLILNTRIFHSDKSIKLKRQHKALLLHSTPWSEKFRQLYFCSRVCLLFCFWYFVWFLASLFIFIIFIIILILFMLLYSIPQIKYSLRSNCSWYVISNIYCRWFFIWFTSIYISCSCTLKYPLIKLFWPSP